MYRILIFAFLIIGSKSSSWIGNDISGVWINSDKDAHIKIYSAYGKYYGEVVWLKEPLDSTTKKPQLDKLNKEPTLRTKPVMHMLVLQSLKFDVDNSEWDGGTIYNPKSGSTYDLSIKMVDKNTLQMHFYLIFSSLGKTFIWNRLLPK